MNTYHQEYFVGQSVNLIQFYLPVLGDEDTILSSEKLLYLLSKRKINSRRVKMRSLRVCIDECVHHRYYGKGYIAVKETDNPLHVIVAHNQYPSYQLGITAKFQWQVYWLDLRAHGRATEAIYEEHDRVKQLIEHRYVPVRIREMIDPNRGQVAELPSATW